MTSAAPEFWKAETQNDELSRKFQRFRRKERILAPFRGVWGAAEELVFGKTKWNSSPATLEDQAQTPPLCVACDGMIFSCKRRKHTPQKSKTLYFMQTDTECYECRPWGNVEEAAHNGCAICKILWDAVPQKHKESIMLPECEGVSCSVHWEPQEHRFSSLNFESYSAIGFFQIVCELLYQSRDNTTDAVATPPPLTGSTLSTESFKLAKYWLYSCLESHKSCDKGQLPSDWLPTRLIDIGDGTRKPRVVITAEIKRESGTPKYIALSHRWPSVPTVTLTLDNLEEFKQKLPMEKLSNTFSDAISICPLFDVKYVWIDSLCIIQGSQDDWVREAEMMRDVYKNCLVNIAATAAASAGTGGTNTKDVGLFAERDPIVFTPLDVQFRWKSHTGRYTCFRTHIWKDEVEESPLNHRAWVLQERLLSPRTLHFGRLLSWECRELCACETYPPGKLWKPHALDGKDSSSKGLFDDLERDHASGRDWEGVVMDYTGRSMTQPRDKLVALSGVAKEMHVLSGDTYLAGLWKSKLYPTLLWHAKKGQYGSVVTLLNNTLANRDSQLRPTVRSKTYRAPTWSWASVEGPISFSMIYDGPSLVKIKSAEVLTQTTDPFGEVKSGQIQLEGKICPVKTPMFYQILEDENFQSEISYYPDDPSDKICAEVLWLMPISYTSPALNLFDTGNTQSICLVLLGNGEWTVRPKDYLRVGLLQLRCSRAPSDESSGPADHEQPNALADAVFGYMSKAPEEIVTIV